MPTKKSVTEWEQKYPGIAKAAGAQRGGHKYLKRVPKAGGGYRYVYQQPQFRYRTGEGKHTFLPPSAQYPTKEEQPKGGKYDPSPRENIIGKLRMSGNEAKRTLRQQLLDRKMPAQKVLRNAHTKVDEGGNTAKRWIKEYVKEGEIKRGEVLRHVAEINEAVKHQHDMIDQHFKEQEKKK